MFERLHRRLYRSLLLFLLLFSLVVNGTVFWILARYNYQHFVALSEGHIEQQQQYFANKLTVTEESLRLFASGGVFQALLAEGQWGEARDRLTEFVQSQASVEGASFYVERDGAPTRVINAAISSPAADVGTLGQTLQAQGRTPYEPQWLLREESIGNTRCFSLLYPVYIDGDRLLGIILLDLNHVQIMGLAAADQALFDGEAMYLYSYHGFWSVVDDLALQEDWQVPWDALGDGIHVLRGQIIAAHQLPKSMDWMISIIPIPLVSMLASMGALLLGIFLLSALLFHFLAKAAARSIADPLQDLRGKMRQTLDAR